MVMIHTFARIVVQDEQQGFGQGLGIGYELNL
jgi:hypothetical protein